MSPVDTFLPRGSQFERRTLLGREEQMHRNHVQTPSPRGPVGEGRTFLPQIRMGGMGLAASWPESGSLLLDVGRPKDPHRCW